MDKNQANKLLKLNKETYDQIASQFNKTRQHLWPEIKDFKKYLKNKQKILDLGCGNGRLIELLKDKEVEYTGIDVSYQLIRKAKEKYPSYHFRVGNLLNLPFAKNKFDLCFAIAVFHHIPSKKYREKATLELKRVLKEKGKAIISVWNLSKEEIEDDEKIGKKNILKKWGQEGKYKRYYHIFDKKEFKKTFKNFKVLEEKYTNYNYWLVVEK